MVPLMRRAEEVLDMSIEGDAKQRGRIGKAKMHAADALEVLRPLLFPED